MHSILAGGIGQRLAFVEVFSFSACLHIGGVPHLEELFLLVVDHRSLRHGQLLFPGAIRAHDGVFGVFINRAKSSSDVLSFVDDKVVDEHLPVMADRDRLLGVSRSTNCKHDEED